MRMLLGVILWCLWLSSALAADPFADALAECRYIRTMELFGSAEASKLDADAPYTHGSIRIDDERKLVKQPPAKEVLYFHAKPLLAAMHSDKFHDYACLCMPDYVRAAVLLDQWKQPRMFIYLATNHNSLLIHDVSANTSQSYRFQRLESTPDSLFPKEFPTWDLAVMWRDIQMKELPNP
jgi:hypothetical protein